MPRIYQYLNYREYLSDWLAEKKRANPAYSYRLLADRAGFRSKSYLAQVIGGTKNLSERAVSALVPVLGLKEKESDYFELLVGFNQARSLVKKNHYFSRLTAIGRSSGSKLIQRSAYEFFSCWYHGTIRELATLIDFKEDYSLLARQVKPRITARQARRSVRLLLRLGLLQRRGNAYVQTDAHVTTGDTVQSLAIENFHLQNLNLAGESLDTAGARERDISCMVVGLSEEGMEKIKSEIHDFRNRLVALIGADTRAARVYHINLQMFPTSQPLTDDEEHV